MRQKDILLNHKIKYSMLEMLKRIAVQKLQEKMAGNPLNVENTGAAAQEGAGALIGALTQKLGAGNIDQVKDLFSNGGQSLGENGIFQELQTKMSSILEAKGMSAADAAAEAKNTAPDLINSLKEKFASTNEADKEFDLSQITNLLGGNTGGILNKVKDLF